MGCQNIDSTTSRAARHHVRTRRKFEKVDMFDDSDRKRLLSVPRTSTIQLASGVYKNLKIRLQQIAYKTPARLYICRS
jgi:hypothetical protein